MTKLSTAKAFILHGFIFFSAAAAAQTSSSDTAFVTASKKNTYAFYNNALRDQIGLFNGSEYVERFDYKNPKGFPYYLSDDWIDGDVVYDSGFYRNVGLMYDVVSDKIVLDIPYSHFKIELVSEKVKSFRINNRDFVRITTFQSDSTFRSGFYEVLYNGKVKAFAKRRKERKEDPHTSGIEVEYLPRDAYFVYRDGNYYRVRSASGLINVFRDKKKALKKSIRAHSGIRFYKRKEESVRLVTKLYDELD